MTDIPSSNKESELEKELRKRRLKIEREKKEETKQGEQETGAEAEAEGEDDTEDKEVVKEQVPKWVRDTHHSLIFAQSCVHKSINTVQSITVCSRSRTKDLSCLTDT